MPDKQLKISREAKELIYSEKHMDETYSEAIIRILKEYKELKKGEND